MPPSARASGTSPRCCCSGDRHVGQLRCTRPARAGDSTSSAANAPRDDSIEGVWLLGALQVGRTPARSQTEGPRGIEAQTEQQIKVRAFPSVFPSLLVGKTRAKRRAQGSRGACSIRGQSAGLLRGQTPSMSSFNLMVTRSQPSRHKFTRAVQHGAANMFVRRFPSSRYSPPSRAPLILRSVEGAHRWCAGAAARQVTATPAATSRAAARRRRRGFFRCRSQAGTLNRGGGGCRCHSGGACVAGCCGGRC